MVAWRRIALGGLGGTIALLSCDRDKAPTPGEVMVEVTTDLQVPQDLNSVQIVVSADGVTQLDQTSSLGPNGLALPATFGIVGGANVAPSTPAKIDIIGYRTSSGGEALPQIVNEAIVTIPESGIVLFRMPLGYLCLNQLKPNASPSDGGARVDGGSGSSPSPYVPSCPTGQTCTAGVCVPETVASSALQPFTPSEVFGGASNAAGSPCFNVASCLAFTMSVTPSGSACSFPFHRALRPAS